MPTMPPVIARRAWHCLPRHKGRLSSESLKNKLVEGLLEVGVNVTEIGLSPTPLLYFSCIKNQAAGGIMITGSHNPKHHNGFKFVFNNMVG